MTQRAFTLQAFLFITIGLLIALLGQKFAASLTTALPRLHTNEAFLEDIRTSRLNLSDTDAVFRYVFSRLNDEVDVYPTENYYYFRFYSGGYEVWGNINVGSKGSHQGQVRFAYFAAFGRREGPFADQIIQQHKFYSAADGVTLTEMDPLTYRVTYRGRSVRFRLHDVPQSPPPPQQLREGETFVFRTFDESGFQLVLLYDTAQPAFRFVLDEAAPLPDTLEQLGDRLLVGRRSGFAFYEDTAASRKVLVGVDARNRDRNNYYDGPFDQLADNFIRDDSFKRHLEAAYPDLKDRITDHAIYADEQGQPTLTRFALQPYFIYDSFAQLTAEVERCRQAEDTAATVACLTFDRQANHE